MILHAVFDTTVGSCVRFSVGPVGISVVSNDGAAIDTANGGEHFEAGETKGRGRSRRSKLGGACGSDRGGSAANVPICLCARLVVITVFGGGLTQVRVAIAESTHVINTDRKSIDHIPQQTQEPEQDQEESYVRLFVVGINGVMHHNWVAEHGVMVGIDVVAICCDDDDDDDDDDVDDVMMMVMMMMMMMIMMIFFYS